MNLLTADDLARLAERAQVQAAALVSRATPPHLVATVDQDGLAVDQVMVARLEGLAAAVGAIAATLDQADIDHLADLMREAFKRGRTPAAQAERARLAAQAATILGR